MKKNIGKSMILAMLLCIALAISAMPVSAAQPTTEVHVIKYASDRMTILNETTVHYTWMRDNLPIMGEDNLYGPNYTHYYFQGPTFDEYNMWDQSESVNVDSRDYGAVAGTNVKDLCELVGGMSPCDEVKIKSPDGFHKWFNYINVYNNRANETLNSRQGPLVICWYNGEESITGDPQGVGYPDPSSTRTGYHKGMRLVFFADTSVNPWGRHVFGHMDMHDCLAEKYWHYYGGYPGFDGWPATSGLSVKWIGEILIYSNSLELSSIEVTPVEVTLDIRGMQQFNATAYDQYGTEMSNINFTWASSNETVGTIDGNGLFVANTTGTATITASNGTVNGTATIKLQVPQIQADVQIKPETLNLNANGEFTAFITLPVGYDVADIDVITVECEGASALSGTIAATKTGTLVVKFERADLVDVPVGDAVEMSVTGELTDGTRFGGRNMVKVIEK